jgi:hypothetical protein
MQTNFYGLDKVRYRARISASAAFAVLVSLLLPTSIVAQGIDPAESARRELVRAAWVAGTPLVENPGYKPVDFDDAWGRMYRIFQYRDWNIGNLEVARSWNEIEGAAQNCLLILTRISQIDNTKPPGLEILEKYVNASSSNATDSQKTDAALTILDRLMMEANKSQLEGQFRSADANLYNSIGSLGDVGDSLPRNPVANAIAIDYLPSWEGAYPADLFEAHNISGADIEYAAMTVTVHFRSGKSMTHIHYIDRWPNGSWLAARYPYYDSDYAFGRTFDDPESVNAVLYLPSGAAAVNYALSEEEWGRILQSYCSHLKFRGQFLGEYTDAEGHVQAPGFEFSFTGLSKLPAKSVEIRFSSADGRVRSLGWNVNRPLEPETEYPVRSEGFQSGELSFSSASPPAHIDFVFRFAGTDYQLHLRLY